MDIDVDTALRTLRLPAGVSFDSLSQATQKELRRRVPLSCGPNLVPVSCPVCSSTDFIKLRYFNNRRNPGKLQPRFACSNPNLCVDIEFGRPPDGGSSVIAKRCQAHVEACRNTLDRLGDSFIRDGTRVRRPGLSVGRRQSRGASLGSGRGERSRSSGRGTGRGRGRGRLQVRPIDAYLPPLQDASPEHSVKSSSSGGSLLSDMPSSNYFDDKENESRPRPSKATRVDNHPPLPRGNASSVGLNNKISSTSSGDDTSSDSGSTSDTSSYDSDEDTSSSDSSAKEEDGPHNLKVAPKNDLPLLMGIRQSAAQEDVSKREDMRTQAGDRSNGDGSNERVYKRGSSVERRPSSISDVKYSFDNEENDLRPRPSKFTRVDNHPPLLRANDSSAGLNDKLSSTSSGDDTSSDTDSTSGTSSYDSDEDTSSSDMSANGKNGTRNSPTQPSKVAPANNQSLLTGRGQSVAQEGVPEPEDMHTQVGNVRRPPSIYSNSQAPQFRTSQADQRRQADPGLHKHGNGVLKVKGPASADKHTMHTDTPSSSSPSSSSSSSTSSSACSSSCSCCCSSSTSTSSSSSAAFPSSNDGSGPGQSAAQEGGAEMEDMHMQVGGASGPPSIYQAVETGNARTPPLETSQADEQHQADDLDLHKHGNGVLKVSGSASAHKHTMKAEDTSSSSSFSSSSSCSSSCSCCSSSSTSTSSSSSGAYSAGTDAGFGEAKLKSISCFWIKWAVPSFESAVLCVEWREFSGMAIGF